MNTNTWLSERITRIKTFPNWATLYVVGALLLLVGVPLVPRSWGGYILFLSGFSMAAGFCVRAWPVLCYVWRRPWGKVLFTGTNIIVAVAAHVLAVGWVAEALELPPESFGETVTLVSLMVLWPVWLFLASVLTLVLTPWLFLVAMAKQTARGFSGDAGISTGAHACGAIALLAVLLYALDNPLTRPAQRSEWIQTIAYYVDFHRIPRFPGAPASSRAKVLENGWLALAIQRNGRIEFNIVPATAPEQPDG